MSPSPGRGEPGAADVAAALLAHPAVARLDGGQFGTVASYLPGRRVVGVRLGEPVEIGVVVHLGRPLPALADELAAVVHGVLGPVRVEVTFCDVVPAAGCARSHADRCA